MKSPSQTPPYVHNAPPVVVRNILQSRLEIKKAIHKDKLIIFFTRILEDIRKYKNTNFYGRLKEIYVLLEPYSDEWRTKKLFEILRKSDLKSSEGMKLDDEETKFVKDFIMSLDDECKIKDRKQMEIKIEEILVYLLRKYMPTSLKIIEGFILGKLLSSVGGIEKLYRKPSSTIQLIGAEKALFRHISKGTPCPKYGIIFDSARIKKSKNPGKTARQLANKIALNARVDYFQHFYNK